MTISLIIATFRRGTAIQGTLDSVLALKDFLHEIIIVDDCSMDTTADWIKENYPAVLLISTPINGGTSTARNFGAKAATGQLLMFLDHDDILLPHAVATLSKLASDFPEAKAFYADHAYINTVNAIEYPDHHRSQRAFHRLHQVRPVRCNESGRLYNHRMYHALLSGNLLQQPWAICRDTFFELGGFSDNIRYCEDWDLYLRVTRSVPIALTDTVISNHIVDGENLHLSPNQAEMHMCVIKKTLMHELARNPVAAVLLSRRLAGYYKSSGDQLRATDFMSAWKRYFRSFCHWPFDYVVAVRTLLWPIKMLVPKRTPRQSNL
jgi:glycosyltransferase involved in cell wall biosynthesis